MHRRNATMIAVISSLLFGFLGFGYGTYRTQATTERIIEKILVDSSSSHLEVHVGALERFRSGGQDNGIELLERLVDLDLANLAAHTHFIAESSNEEVISHVRLAREYRRRFPNHVINTNLVNSVNRALALAR